MHISLYISINAKFIGCWPLRSQRLMESLAWCPKQGIHQHHMHSLVMHEFLLFHLSSLSSLLHPMLWLRFLCQSQSWKSTFVYIYMLGYVPCFMMMWHTVESSSADWYKKIKRINSNWPSVLDPLLTRTLHSCYLCIADVIKIVIINSNNDESREAGIE